MTEQYLLIQSFYLPADVISRTGLIENMERLQLIRTAELLKLSYLATDSSNIVRLGSKAQSVEVLNCCRRSLRSFRSGTITANQDCGTIEALIPRYGFQQHCPIRFKGPECRGTELLSEKSAEFPIWNDYS